MTGNLTHITSIYAISNQIHHRTQLFSDINHDSEISWNEFLAFQGQAKSSLKATWPFDVTQIRNEFSNLDIDGSGAISREEFIQVMTNSFDRK